MSARLLAGGCYLCHNRALSNQLRHRRHLIASPPSLSLAFHPVSGRRGCSAPKLVVAFLLTWCRVFSLAVCKWFLGCTASSPTRAKTNYPTSRRKPARSEKKQKEGETVKRNSPTLTSCMRHLSGSWQTSKPSRALFPVPPLVPDTCIASQTSYYAETSLFSNLTFLFHSICLLRR